MLKHYYKVVYNIGDSLALTKNTTQTKPVLSSLKPKNLATKATMKKVLSKVPNKIIIDASLENFLPLLNLQQKGK